MDAGCDPGSAAEELAADLEVNGSGLVGCGFSVTSSFLATCKSPTCLQ